MKKKYKFLTGLGFFIFIAAILVSILPAILSSTGGRTFALNQINQRIPGQLNVNGWSLRWLGDISIEELTFNDINGHRLLALPKMTITRGLLALIHNHNDFGHIRLIDPIVSIIPSPQKPSLLQIAETDSTAHGGSNNKAASKNMSKETPMPKTKDDSFTLPNIKGSITIENASIQLSQSDAPSISIAENLNFELALNGNGQPISFVLQGNSGTSEGSFTGSGTLILPADNVIDLNSTELDMNLEINNLDMNPLSTLLGSYSDIPALSGKLNTEMAVKGNLDKGVSIKTDLSSIQLSLPEKNADFGDIKISLDGNATKTSANINIAKVHSDFFHITAAGSYGSSGRGKITATSDMNIKTTIDFLKAMGIITNDMSCTGKLKIAIEGESEGDLININQADMNITDLHLDYEGKKLNQKSLAFTAPSKINVSERKIHIPTGKLTTSFGTITLSSLNIGDWNNLLGTTATELQTDIDIQSTRAVLSDFINITNNLNISGQLKTNLKIDFSKASKYKLNLKASTSEFKIESTDSKIIIQDTPMLSAELTASSTSDEINLQNLNLNSKLLDLNMAAVLVGKDKEHSLQIKGTFAPSMTELSHYVKAHSDIPVEFTGKKSEPFDIKVKWRDQGDSMKILAMDGHAGLYTDTIDGFGFHVRNLTVPVVLKDNKVEVQIKAKVNDGLLDFKSSIDFSGEKPHMYIPANLVILKDINITTEVADELLGLINPIFYGISTVNGKMSFVMNNFSWPLDPSDMMDRIFSGRMIFNDVSIAANGLLDDLLDLVKENTRELNVEESNIDISCADGKIKSSPLHLKIKKYELIFDGTVGLDKSLNYLAKVPITEDLVGKSGYKYLGGTSLDIPITGTIQDPILNLKSFQKALSKLIADATSKLLSNELENQFKKLFE